MDRKTTTRADLIFFSAVSLLGLFFRPYIGVGAIDAVLTSQFKSSSCDQYDLHEESEEIRSSYSLKRLPGFEDIPLLEDCEPWAWSGGNCEKKEKKPCLRTNLAINKSIIGGVESETTFPWDVSIRFINDWGDFFESSTAQDLAQGHIKGLNESHSCVGVLYSSKYFITSGWCGVRGKNHIRQTNNRLLISLPGGNGPNVKLLEASPKSRNRKKGEIHVHPNFNPDPIAGSTNKDHDISIFEVSGPDFTLNEEDVLALAIAPMDKSFAGTRAKLVVWGATNFNSSLASTHLETKYGFDTIENLDMTVLEFSGSCEKAVQSYLEKTDDNENDESERDASKRYICATTENFRGRWTADNAALICSEGHQKFLCGVRTKSSRNVITESESHYRYNGNVIEMFVRPSVYLPWIEKIAGKQNLKN